MSLLVITLIWFFRGADSHAQMVGPPVPRIEIGEPSVTQISPIGEVIHSSNSRSTRGDSRFVGLAEYSLFDLILPGKFGASIGSIKSADTTWELEYLRTSIGVPFLVGDLGAMTDQRLSLSQRSFLGTNSFNLSYGITYFSYSIHLGSSILNRVGGGNLPSGVDLIETQALGLNFGLGNRWTLGKNVTVGVDWLSLAQPIIQIKRRSVFLDYASDPNDRNNIDRALKIISYFPRFAAIKLAAGVSF